MRSLIKFIYQRFLILILFACAINVLPAAAQQKQNEIAGTVKEKNGDALPAATVSLLRPKDSSVISRQLSDENGKFLFENTTAGNYLLRIQNIGFKPAWRHISITNNNPSLQLKNIILSPDVKLLKGVTVTEKKPTYQFKKDSVIFNVAEDFLPGGMGNDLLEYAPGVMVDGNNNITVDGNTQVKYYVDNEPIEETGEDANTYLQNIPAFMIEKIEILKTPPDPDDARKALTEGRTDISYINIITRKIKFHGYAGDLTGGIDSRKNLQERMRFNLNLKPFQLTYFNNSHINSDSSYMNRTSFSQGQDTSYLMQDNYSRSYHTYHNLQARYDWKFAEKEKLMTNVIIGWNGSTSKNDNTNELMNYKQELQQSVLQHNTNNSTGYQLGGNAVYHKEYDKEGKKLKAELHFYKNNNGGNNNKDILYEVKNDSALQHSDRDNNNYHLKSSIDYDNKIKEDIYYGFGMNTDVQQRLNVNNTFLRDTGDEYVTYNVPLSTHYKVGDQHYSTQENIQKRNEKFGWILLSTQSVDRQNAKEALQQSRFTHDNYSFRNAVGINFAPDSGQNIAIHFLPGLQFFRQNAYLNNDSLQIPYSYNFFSPGFNIAYSRNRQQLSLHYGKGIDLPDYDQLNPYVDNEDKFNVHSGNPDLKPSFNNHYELNYEYRRKHQRLRLRYRNSREKDVISSYTTVDSNGVSYTTYVNLDQRLSDNLSLRISSFFFKPLTALKGNLNINANGSLDYFHTRTEGVGVSDQFKNVSGLTPNISVWSALHINIFSISVYGRYAGARYFAQGKIPPRFNSGLRSDVRLLNNKLIFSLNIRNLFGSSAKTRYLQTDNYIQTSLNRQNRRYIQLNITYKFRHYKKSDDKEDDDHGGYRDHSHYSGHRGES